jgi:Fe2+ or Zn2+ uptake regulation protein
MQNKQFYNTIGLKGKNYHKAIQNAHTQSERILTILKFKKVAMTPFDVWHEYQKYYPPCPVTSIRRSLTNLTQQGFLEKSETMGMGIYGMPNNKWKSKI